ncbi:unnamed protein product [Schistosoma margrebowiei]|uniref:Uncharacterized protein n=1 Tax=Schistosoma margrebowiei TaxID=48269 RepID=A0A183MW80_9TREM|nr:unnamed protein product [Schistosoma margrebowiei]
MGISWTRNHQTIIQNKEGGNHSECFHCYTPINDNNDNQFHGRLFRKGPDHPDGRSKRQGWNQQHRVWNYHGTDWKKRTRMLEKQWTTGQTELTFNSDFLRDTNELNEFKIALNNRFQALQYVPEEETTMEDNWKDIKEALISTGQEMLGRKKHHHKEWITIETPGVIRRRKNNRPTRAEKTELQTGYTKVNKTVKNSIRADKRKYMENLEMTAEKLRDKLFDESNPVNVNEYDYVFSTQAHLFPIKRIQKLVKNLHMNPFSFLNNSQGYELVKNSSCPNIKLTTSQYPMNDDLWKATEAFSKETIKEASSGYILSG